jgi:hypothetical protein
MSRNSYYENDLYGNNSLGTTATRSNRNSTGGIKKPKTEWTTNAERGPTLNSKHYKLLSKKTLDSLQALKSVNHSDRLSTPSNIVKPPKNVVYCPDSSLEIIIEEDAVSCSKNTNYPTQSNVKVLKPVLSNLSSASTDTIDITGNNTEHSNFHEINAPKKKRDEFVSDHQSILNEKKLSEMALNNRNSCSIQKLLQIKTSDYSMNGGDGDDAEDESVNLLMPKGNCRPRNDSDCTIDYNCCSDDSTGKDVDIIAATEDDVEVNVLKTGHAAQQKRSEEDSLSLSPEGKCSQQDMLPVQNAVSFAPVVHKTISICGDEWSSLEDSPVRSGETIASKTKAFKTDKTVSVKCGCVIC